MSVLLTLAERAVSIAVARMTAYAAQEAPDEYTQNRAKAIVWELSAVQSRVVALHRDQRKERAS